MKKIFLILLFSISVQFVSAQLTQAEINKMIKEAQVEVDKMKKDPKMKEIMKDMPKMDTLKRKIPNGNSQPTAKNKKTETVDSLADKNVKLLNALPIRTFTRAELISYLHNLNTKLTELLRNGYGIDISNIPVDMLYRSGSGIGLWLNGEPEKSVLVALKGAELNPDNLTLLNNAGGILTSCGLSINAIPVLQYVLEKEPGNNIVLNNIGQAYLDLGDDKKAEQYLLRCIKSYNYYPDANLALAVISERGGNKSSAIKYTENSLRGAWSVKATNMLYKLKHVPKMMEYIKHRYKSPDHFNYHKYPILPQCRKVSDIPVMVPQYEAYEKVLAALEEKYRLLEKEASESYEKSAMEDATKAMKAWRDPAGPFGSFARSMVGAVHQEHQDKLIPFLKYKHNYYEAIKKLQHEFNEEHRTASGCGEKYAIINSYLPRFAELNEAYQAEIINVHKNYLDDFYYWSSIAAVNAHGPKTIFYGVVQDYISILRDINNHHLLDFTSSTTSYSATRAILYDCLKTEKGSAKAKEMVVEEQPDCYLGPAKLVLPLGVLKLEISCEAYKLEAGAGFIGKLEYDRMKGETTLAFGVGASIPSVFFKKAGAEFGGEGEVKSQFYITFDKSGPADLGVLWEAEVKLVAGIGETKVEVGLEEEALTVGFGSGVNMKEGGALKALIDKTYYVQPDDKQINKNVPLYKK